MEYIEISEGLSIKVSAIEGVERRTELTCAVMTHGNIYESTFPYEVLLQILESRDTSVADEKRKIEDKMRNIDDVSSRFFKVISSLPKMNYESPDDALLTLTKRSANVEEIWNRLHDETEKEFLVFAGDVSWINRRAKEVKKLTRKGIGYKVIWFKCTKDVLPNIRKAMKAGAELRCFDEFSNDLRGIISDNNRVYLIQKLPKPGMDVRVRPGALWNEEFASYTGTLITSKTIAKVFREYFYFLWSRATTTNEVFKKYK